jgi:hypothetical protein
MKLTLPGIAAGPDGKLRSRIDLALTGKDTKGFHFEMRRNGKLVFEEWREVGTDGLTATQRKSEEQNGVVIIDPPQVLLPWPPSGMNTWNYQSKEGSLKQVSRSWGPLPVEGPKGKVPGFIVFTMQEVPVGNATSIITVERHFIPGVGLVREISTTAVKETLISREEMILKEVK